MTKRGKRSPYSRERKATALATARIAGAEVASDRTGIPVQTIRRWMDAVGVQPGAELPQERLEAIRDLAETSVIEDLVAGRIPPVQRMTIGAISRRNIAKATEVPVAAVTVREQFLDWLVDTVANESLDSEGALAAMADAIEDVVPKLLLRRANAESVPVRLEENVPSAHRLAILAWLSDRPEVLAGDVLSWAQAQVLEVIAEHGSLVAWHAHQQAEDAAEEAKRAAAEAEARARAEEARAAARQAMLDNETRSVLAAAEAYLRRESTGV